MFMGLFMIVNRIWYEVKFWRKVVDQIVDGIICSSSKFSPPFGIPNPCN